MAHIILRFDQPMAPRINVRVGPAGREHFPEVTGVHWDETGTALTLDVKLKPAWSYELLLGGGLVSRTELKPIPETVVQFRTR